MLTITQDDIKIINRLNENIRRTYDSRMQFLLSNEADELSKGIFDPFYFWDTLPPLLFERVRIWNNGVSWIQGITKGAQKYLPPIPENVWSAIEGGRIKVIPTQTEVGKFYDRKVVKGSLQYAEIEGSQGTPIIFDTCVFDECLFWHSRFQDVVFKDCDFLRSKFIKCQFVNCTLSGTFFDNTRWGDAQLQRSYNIIKNSVINGELSYRNSKGVGPALFMPSVACKISLKQAMAGDYTVWKGEQVKEAARVMGW